MADEKKCDINGKTVLTSTKKNLKGNIPEIKIKDNYYSLSIRPLGKCCSEAEPLTVNFQICEAEAKIIAKQKVKEQEDLYSISLSPSNNEHREHQLTLIITEKELSVFLDPIEKRMK